MRLTVRILPKLEHQAARISAKVSVYVVLYKQRLLTLSLPVLSLINYRLHEVNRGDFGRRCAKIVRAHRLFPANFAFRCFAKYNFKDVKFSAL